jgi:Bacterial transcriptional activator domain
MAFVQCEKDTLFLREFAFALFGGRLNELVGRSWPQQITPNWGSGTHRLALEAEAALGLRQAVLERYEALRRLLDERLGLEPQRETRTLGRQLLGQELRHRP